MVVMEQLPLERKLEILSDAAKYDVACTSSGVERKGTSGGMGNTAACGICHSFAADGRCISLLKILYTNECVYDCKYCLNRRSNDTVRTSFTPEEVSELTMQFYRRNYIEGLFLSSGVRHNPTETMEQIYIALRLLREKHHFNGYIHVKAIPGAAPEIVAAVGLLADRMSTNLELPTAEGLRRLAPNKTRETILKPMRQIQLGIAQANRGETLRISQLSGNAGAAVKDCRSGTAPWGFSAPDPALSPADLTQNADPAPSPAAALIQTSLLPDTSSGRMPSPERTKRQLFVPAGQSTQMIVGATPEDDYQVLSVAEALYQRFDLKRVFYSAYVALNDDSSLPALGTKPPLLREHRLYQADWLLRFYGFQANELLTPERPNFNVFLDPKCEWALRHLEYFPVEINRAPYQLLLRIPGVGVKSAKRIVRARRGMKLDFDGLKRIGVVLKRAHYFITCNGKMMYPTRIDEDYITRNLIDLDKKKNWEIAYGMSYRQLSLFDDQSTWAG
ncbi:MAG: putative DNA modification/repair radical SAM protein [Clostridium sp.]|nr:putative DNA modification/repair radical SAM protein [Clostridium sp.]